MKQVLKFKTSLECPNCVSKVKPFLDKITGIDNWSVDTDSEEKTLTVEAESSVTPQQIIDAVENVGFDIEKI